jgi:hypothetical protein
LYICLSGGLYPVAGLQATILISKIIAPDGFHFVFEGHTTPPPIFKPILSEALTERNVFLSFSGVLDKINVLLTVEEKGA